MRTRHTGSLMAWATLLIGSVAHAAPRDYFAIRVVDDATGRGIPLVELNTTYEARYVTDSAGYVAFLEPGLMDGQDVWFDVRSYGYESPKGPLDGKGLTLKPVAGKSAEVRLKRINIAERLYRQTGYGIYRDSVLLGKRSAKQSPLLNARVTGQDTIQTALYKGKYYWFWQDTDQLGFFLGCFSMTGATAPLPAKLDLDEGIDFTYFVNKPGDFARAMASVQREGTNPIWVDGMTVVKDDRGNEKMIGRYAAVDHSMKTVEAGLLLYNDEKQVFERLIQFPGDGTQTVAPSGKPYYIKDAGVTYACYPPGDSMGVRVRAEFASVSDPAAYESFTCFDADGKIVRDADGKPHWRWVRGAERAKRDRLNELVKAGELKREDVPLQVVNVETGKPVTVASGSIAWNPHLKRWTFVFGETFGDSMVGEVWLATAHSPEGPWRDARKIATHAMKDNNQDFYNVIQHNELQPADGKTIYFEGTFVNTFSGTKIPVPYYNYNNVLYRVDLTDPRLALPDPPKGYSSVTPMTE